MIRLAIAGALGRTGRRVVELAAADRRFQLAAALVTRGGAGGGQTMRAADREMVPVESLEHPCDVLVDFTVPAGTMTWLAECQDRGIPMVIGATGHSNEQRAVIRDAAAAIPIVKAANFSVGVQVLAEAAVSIARALGGDYDVEIVERHHRHKVDAPSGTALTLAEAIAAALGRHKDEIVYGRHGAVGPRPPGQIGVHAVRMGDVVGDHVVYFSGPGETLSIRHTARSRDTFAAGALRAAAWIVGKPPGLYTMRDVLR